MGRKKAKLECVLITFAVGHLGCCTTSTWLVFVITALLYVWGLISPDVVSQPPTARMSFFLGLLIAWVVSATLASLLILLYSWNLRMQPSKPKLGGK